MPSWIQSVHQQATRQPCNYRFLLRQHHLVFKSWTKIYTLISHYKFVYKEYMPLWFMLGYKNHLFLAFKIVSLLSLSPNRGYSVGLEVRICRQNSFIFWRQCTYVCSSLNQWHLLIFQLCQLYPPLFRICIVLGPYQVNRPVGHLSALAPECFELAEPMCELSWWKSFFQLFDNGSMNSRGCCKSVWFFWWSSSLLTVIRAIGSAW